MSFPFHQVSIARTKETMADNAARYTAQKLHDALRRKRTVRLVAATGASQLEFLERLTANKKDVDWTRVELFHLDEYVGIGMEHPASFARYIKERIVDAAGIRTYHLIDGLGDPETVAREMGVLIAAAPVDVACVGVGENAHLAFNDPPADFDTETPYLVVNLDEACRRQQVGEGWFGALEEVPARAISMSVRQIMKARAIVCTVPDARKANAVKAVFENEATPEVPASVLRLHNDVKFFLDAGSASLLTPAL